MPQDGTEIFQHYRVLRRDDGSLWELGRGAMGVTYKAVDEDLHSEVALKVIQPAILGSEEAGQRFLREARSLARLRHPNIATIFRLGRTGDGSYFYAMEFCAGQTLQQFVEQQGPVEPAVALEMVGQISKALIMAEEHHLVHRDLKPANLILTHRSDDGMVIKVIDFGLAKNYGGADAQTSAWVSLSTAGFIGTAHFASPEQLEERELDTRADIYSLGATLWFLLTGRPMFEGSLAKVMNQHLCVPAPLDRLRGKVPPGVVALVGRMVEKDRDLRPATAMELRREVQDCLQALRQGEGDPAATIALLSPSASQTMGPRYRLLDEKGRGHAGRLFRAADTSDRDAPVAVRALGGTLAADSAALGRIAAEVEKARAHPHPNFLRVHPLAAGPDGVPWLVTEWVTGFSLLDLLRARHTLDLRTALSLAGPLAETVDHATAHGLNWLDLEKRHIFFHFPDTTPEAAAGLASVPSSEWPAFTLKLNPVGLAPELSGLSAESPAAMATMPPGHPPRPAAMPPGRHYPQEWAALIYETLGGTDGSQAGNLDHRKYVPLSTLTEAGNDVLRRALGSTRGQGDVTARAWFDALETAGSPGPAPGGPAPKRVTSGIDRQPVAEPTRRSVNRAKVGAVAGAILLLASGAVVFFVSRPAPPDRGALPTASPPAAGTPAGSASSGQSATPSPDPAPLGAADLTAKLLTLPSSEDRLALLKAHREMLTNDFLIRLGAEGDSLAGQGQAEPARQRFTLVTEAAEVAGNQAARGAAFVSRGDVYRNLGQFTEAMQDYRTAREIAAQVTDNVKLNAMAAHGMGVVFLKLSRWSDAEMAFQEEIPLDKDLPNKASLADAWNNLGVSYMGLNNYPEAIKALDKGRVVAQNIGYAAGVGHAQQNINASRQLMAQSGSASANYNAPNDPGPTRPPRELPTLARGVWLFPDSSSRRLGRDELSRLDDDTLWRARNEIYARNGLAFSTPRGKAFAATLGGFYHGVDPSQDRVFARMNKVEQANVELIQSLEQHHH